MKNVRIVYFGGKEVLHLTMISLPKGKEIVTRFDNILPQEGPRHREDLLIIGMDDRIINIGFSVPDSVVREVVDRNPLLDDGYTGFMVTPRHGYKVIGAGVNLTLKRAGSEPEACKTVTRDIREDDTVVVTEQQIRESKFDIVKETVKEQTAQLPSAAPPKPVESRREKKRKHKETKDPVFTKLAEGL